MTLDEYKKGLSRLAKDYELQKQKLARDYAFANNTYKLGDVVTDHIGTLKIELITWSYDANGMPCCVYYGSQLTKSGKPKVQQDPRRCVWQFNIIKHDAI